MYDSPMSSSDSTNKAATYASYLKIDQLLDLQDTRTEEQDETLFIIIHQVYELWFKQVLHEMRFLQEALEKPALGKSMVDFNRILTILKTMVGQIDVLETMSPVSFLTFRDRLDSASGFQSAQFRELEYVLGQKRPGAAELHPEGSPGRHRIESALARPTLWDSFVLFVHRSGYAAPADLLERDVTQSVGRSPEFQQSLLEMYREDCLETQICERMVDLDEGLQEWRYRHVKMVERTIGHKPGTGGSEGAEYLKKTLFQPLFPDLWEIRSQL